MTESGYLTPGFGPEYSRNLDSVSASAITHLKLHSCTNNVLLASKSLSDLQRRDIRQSSTGAK